jgi:hypothetical protein
VRDIGVAVCLRHEDPHRAVQRLLDEARDLGLVGHVEAGIEVRFEWELAEQRQAERVDGADRDFREAIAQLDPARLVER